MFQKVYLVGRIGSDIRLALERRRGVTHALIQNNFLPMDSLKVMLTGEGVNIHDHEPEYLKRLCEELMKMSDFALVDIDSLAETEALGSNSFWEIGWLSSRDIPLYGYGSYEAYDLLLPSFSTLSISYIGRAVTTETLESIIY